MEMEGIYHLQFHVELMNKLVENSPKGGLIRGGLAGRAIRADSRREKVRESMETICVI